MLSLIIQQMEHMTAQKGGGGFRDWTSVWALFIYVYNQAGSPVGYALVKHPKAQILDNIFGNIQGTGLRSAFPKR